MSKQPAAPEAAAVYAIGSVGKSKPLEVWNIATANKIKNPKTGALTTTGEVEPWYDGTNLFPNKIKEIIEKTPLINSILHFLSNSIVSGGLAYGSIEYDATGQTIYRRNRIPEVEAFLKKSNVARYLREISYEYYAYGNAFAQIVKGAQGKVESLSAVDSVFCRFAKADERGNFKEVYMTAERVPTWTRNSQYMTVIDALNPYFDVPTQLADAKASNLMYPLQGISTGNTTYQFARWHSLIFGKWIDISVKAGLYIDSLLQREATVKYLIYVSEDYFSRRFGDLWANQEQREKLKNDVKTEFENALSGAANAGKSVFIPFFYNTISGAAQDTIRIDSIEDKIDPAKYLEPTDRSTQQILAAFGVDPTLFGANFIKGMGAGSGSDKRIAAELMTLQSKPDQDLILEPLNHIAEVNGWGDISFWFNNYALLTQNNVSLNNRM